MRILVLSVLFVSNLSITGSFVIKNELVSHCKLDSSIRMAASYNTDKGAVDEDSDDEVSWNQFWKKDNTLSTIMSASFVAKDWIQSLPCAMGIADCDMPEKAKLPATAKGAGVEQIDALTFLNIKRVKPLEVPKPKKGTVPIKRPSQLTVAEAEEMEVPSWQDMWRKENTMSTITSASFVAKDWIQSLPCALGIADCDMPESLKLPATARGAGVDQVDAKNFLNIKRVKPLEAPKKVQKKNSPTSVKSDDVEEIETPSWQDMWKKDNTLSTVMSASFIPKQWITGLSKDADLPATAKNAGVEKVSIRRSRKDYEI